MIYIYALVDPRDSSIRYVGKTNKFNVRIKRHICDARRFDKSNWDCNSHVARWIRRLLAEDMYPAAFILEEVDDTNWEDAERWWIKYYRDSGENLCNHADGGGSSFQGLKHTEETKAKMSARQRGKPKSLEAATNSGLARRGGKMSDSMRSKLSASKKGVKFSKSHCESLSKAFMGHKVSDETRAKISATRIRLGLCKGDSNPMSRVSKLSRIHLGGEKDEESGE